MCISSNSSKDHMCDRRAFIGKFVPQVKYHLVMCRTGRSPSRIACQRYASITKCVAQVGLPLAMMASGKPPWNILGPQIGLSKAYLTLITPIPSTFYCFSQFHPSMPWSSSRYGWMGGGNVVISTFSLQLFLPLNSAAFQISKYIYSENVKHNLVSLLKQNCFVTQNWFVTRF